MEIHQTNVSAHKGCVARKGGENGRQPEIELLVVHMLAWLNRAESRHDKTCCVFAPCFPGMQVCWMCESTKGSDDLSYAYTNVDEGAAWRATIWSTAPWPVNEPPAFAELRGFDLKMVAIDMLHCFHLGIGRDLIGSAVKTLVRLRYWPIEKSLAHATLSLRRWAKQRRLTLACKSLTKSNIGWHQLYPELRAKGYDCYVVLAWLAEETSSHRPLGTTALEQDYLDRICATIWCANSWISSCSNAGMFLTEHQQEHKTVIGSHYVNLYIGLAGQALAEKKKCGE